MKKTMQIQCIAKFSHNIYIFQILCPGVSSVSCCPMQCEQRKGEADSHCCFGLEQGGVVGGEEE